jgi:hypothetical protein
LRILSKKSFVELLAEVAERHDLEVKHACKELQVEKKRLEADSANLRKELGALRSTNGIYDDHASIIAISEETQASGTSALDAAGGYKPLNGNDNPSVLKLPSKVRFAFERATPPNVPRHEGELDENGIEVMTLDRMFSKERIKPSSEAEALPMMEQRDSQESSMKLKIPDPGGAPRRLSSAKSTLSAKEPTAPQHRPSRAVMRRKELFPDSEALKDEVRDAVKKKESYSVERFYWNTGWCQMIARSPTFENMTFAVIFLVTIWLAIDADYNNSQTLVDAEWPFIIGANFFCSYFTFELSVRFGAFRRKRDIIKDFSFMFDAVLVIQDIIETWIMTIYLLASEKTEGSPMNFQVLRVLRMAKLFRMGRAVRLMRALPELAILVKGISIATRSVFFTLLLLMLIIYVFAISFRQLTADTPIGEQYFPNIPTAINSLLLDGVLPDNAQIVNDLTEQDWYLWPIIMFFLLLAALTVMNMLVGVLVEVVGTVAASEKEEMAVIQMREQLKIVMEELDADQTGCISRAEFAKILTNRNAAKHLHEIGVDVVGLVDLAEFIFEDYGLMGELDLEDFLGVVLDLRDSNTAKVKDVVMMQKLLKRDLTMMQTMMSTVVKTLQVNPREISSAEADAQTRSQSLEDPDEEEFV